MNSMRNNNINLGDRVFARLTLGGRTIVEFMINCVNNTEELMAELYRITKGIRGLAKLYIRNQSQGWAEERAVMLYADTPRTSPKLQTTAATAPRMHFPWESH